MTKVGLYAINTSTTLEANKSLENLAFLNTLATQSALFCPWSCDSECPLLLFCGAIYDSECPVLFLVCDSECPVLPLACDSECPLF